MRQLLCILSHLLYFVTIMVCDVAIVYFVTSWNVLISAPTTAHHSLTKIVISYSSSNSEIVALSLYEEEDSSVTILKVCPFACTVYHNLKIIEGSLKKVPEKFGNFLRVLMATLA